MIHPNSRTRHKPEKELLLSISQSKPGRTVIRRAEGRWDTYYFYNPYCDPLVVTYHKATGRPRSSVQWDCNGRPSEFVTSLRQLRISEKLLVKVRS